MRNSSCSFLLILLKLHMCFGHIAKMCMWYVYYPQIDFVQALLLSKCIYSGYLVRATPANILPSLR